MTDNPYDILIVSQILISLSPLPVLEDSINRAQIKLTDVADNVQGDWVILAHQLDITTPEIEMIKQDYNTVNDQALAMLQLWVKKKGDEATGTIEYTCRIYRAWNIKPFTYLVMKSYKYQQKCARYLFHGKCN